MKLTCNHCGEVFLVGEDAFLVTDEDTVSSLREANAGALFLGRPNRKPEMVMHWTRPATADECGCEARKAVEVAEAIARGEDRQWWCGKCKNDTPNPYP